MISFPILSPGAQSRGHKTKALETAERDILQVILALPFPGTSISLASHQSNSVTLDLGRFVTPPNVRAVFSGMNRAGGLSMCFLYS